MLQQRPLYIAAYTVTYVAVALGLGFLAVACWWTFALLALEEFGCDGLFGPCGSVGRFTSDYWELMNAAASVLIALALAPVYRRLLDSTRGVDAPAIGGISDAPSPPGPHPKRPGEFR